MISRISILRDVTRALVWAFAGAGLNDHRAARTRHSAGPANGRAQSFLRAGWRARGVPAISFRPGRWLAPLAKMSKKCLSLPKDRRPRNNAASNRHRHQRNGPPLAGLFHFLRPKLTGPGGGA